MPYDQLPSLTSATLSRRGVIDMVIRRQAVQLAAALSFAVLMPYLFRFGPDGITHAAEQWFVFEAKAPNLWEHDLSVIWSLLGVILTHMFFRQFSRYPGEDGLSSAIPATLLGFGSIVIVILLGQYPYSRSLLISGFSVTLVWYSLLNALQSRAARPRFVLATIGTGRGLSNISGVDWHKLTQPGSTALVKESDGVVIDLEADLPLEWSDFLIRCASEGIPIYDSTRTREFLTGQVELIHAGDIGLETLLPKRGYIFAKTATDFLLALISMPVVVAVIALAALAIRLDSRGPIIFIQKRVGFRGKTFNCYKLRTMLDRRDVPGPSFTSEGDPRITRVGRVLRKYRLDELPQIFNVLKGDMSWIGPRPEAAELAEEYQRHIPFYAFRHAVKPGISGWAAIRQGNVAQVEAATLKLQQDFFYIKNLSPSLDAFIAARTVWILLTGFGSR